MLGYIYLITNKVINKQYVGQTIKTIKTRYSQHLSAARNNSDNCYLHNSMNKYGFDNFKIEEIDCIYCSDKSELLNELNKLEIYYIAKYNTLIPNGYNLTAGGTSGAELYKRKVDEYDLDGNFIKTHNSIIDAALCLNVSQGSNSIIRCCKGTYKYAFQRIWRYHNDPLNKYDLQNINTAQQMYKKISVDKYSINGELIKTYYCISDIQFEYTEKINTSHISECCMGKLYTAYGYVWRYHGESFNKYNVKADKRFKKCQLFSLDEKLLGTYDSIKEACESVNLDYKKCNSHIVSCCKGNRNTAYGYKWKYI